MIPPRVRTVSRDGSTAADIFVPTAKLTQLVEEATNRQREIVVRGSIGGRGVIGDVEYRRSKNELWITPGAAGLFRYSLTDKIFIYHDMVDDRGGRVGLQDLELLDDSEFIGLAGPVAVRGRLP